MSDDRKIWSHKSANQSVYGKKYHKVNNSTGNRSRAKVSGGFAVFLFAIIRFFFDLLVKGIPFAFKGLGIAISFIFRLFKK